MAIKELSRRYVLFLIGLFINSLGICFIIKADLGSSPISSLPYTFSLRYPMSLGTFTFILNFFMIVGQKIVLGKDFKQREWLQLPISILFGAFIDFSMWMLSWIVPENYIMKLVVLFIGCGILGLGVSLEVIANVLMLAGEAFVQAVCVKYKKEFGIVKICFDCSLMILAVISSLIISGKILGVREGTIVAALVVGLFARFFNKKLSFINRYLVDSSSQVVEDKPTAVAGNAFVVTIAREFGSGGREIGKRLAERFHIPFYDKELIDMAAKDAGVDVDYVASREQNIPSSLLYEMVMQDFTSPLEKSLSHDDALFVVQSRIVRKLAAKGSCVIIGRCANYVLRDYPNCFKVFVHADYDSKLERVITEYHESREQAIEDLERVDRGRANHYKTYTGGVWNDASNYDLSLDSGKFGVDGCVRIIEESVRKRYTV